MFIVISKQKCIRDCNKFYRIDKKLKLIETKFVRKRGERVHAEMKTSSKTRQRNGESQYAKAYLTIKFNDVQLHN